VLLLTKAREGEEMLSANDENPAAFRISPHPRRATDMDLYIHTYIQNKAGLICTGDEDPSGRRKSTHLSFIT
jgi:hypothetical protein